VNLYKALLEELSLIHAVNALLIIIILSVHGEVRGYDAVIAAAGIGIVLFSLTLMLVSHITLLLILREAKEDVISRTVVKRVRFFAIISLITLSLAALFSVFTMFSFEISSINNEEYILALTVIFAGAFALYIAAR